MAHTHVCIKGQNLNFYLEILAITHHIYMADKPGQKFGMLYWCLDDLSSATHASI